MGKKKLFVDKERGGGGKGMENYPLPSHPCLGREREMKEKKQSQLLLIINSQCFREEGNGKESHM